MKIHVTSCPGDRGRDRRNTFHGSAQSRSLPLLDIEYDMRFPDARDYTIEKLVEIAIDLGLEHLERQTTGDYHKGTVAAICAQQLTLKYIAENATEPTLFCQDKAIFYKNFSDLMVMWQALLNHNASAQVLYLHHHVNIPHNIFVDERNYIEPTQNIPTHTDIYPNVYGFGTDWAMILTPAGAKKLYDRCGMYDGLAAIEIASMQDLEINAFSEQTDFYTAYPNVIGAVWDGKNYRSIHHEGNQ